MKKAPPKKNESLKLRRYFITLILAALVLGFLLFNVARLTKSRARIAAIIAGKIHMPEHSVANNKEIVEGLEEPLKDDREVGELPVQESKIASDRKELFEAMSRLVQKDSQKAQPKPSDESSKTGEIPPILEEENTVSESQRTAKAISEMMNGFIDISDKETFLKKTFEKDRTVAVEFMKSVLVSNSEEASKLAVLSFIASNVHNDENLSEALIEQLAACIAEPKGPGRDVRLVLIARAFISTGKDAGFVSATLKDLFRDEHNSEIRNNISQAFGLNFPDGNQPF